jgi:hypothetical protein
LVAGWNDFCEAVKYKTRFLFFDPNPHEPGEAGTEPYYVHPSELLDELASAVKTLNLTTTLPIATVIYRARAHGNGLPGHSTVAELGPPPKEVARAGRMNAQGIVVFYGAFDDQTAIAEINRPGDAMSVGIFRNITTLRVLDLTKLPAVPSIFDLKRKALRTPLNFMARFRDDISQAIRPDDQLHLEYTPTQIVTEYFRARFKDRDDHPLDGLVYPSARREGGRNVALFISREQIEGIESERSYIKPVKKLTLDSITIIPAPTSQQPSAGNPSV